MKKTMQLQPAFSAWILLLYFSISCNVPQTTPEEAGPIRNVVIIGVDGMSPGGIKNAKTPVLDDLIKNGSYTFEARAVRPTSSSSNWASMVMGAGPEQHGVTSNDWERDNYEIAPVITGEENIFPTVFTLFKRKYPEEKTAAIYHWRGFGRLVEESIISFSFRYEDEKATVSKAVEILENEKPRLTFIHLDHVDGVGHHSGHMTEDYFQSIAYTDGLIEEIIEATKRADTFDNTVFIISSDHGGVEKGHGGDSPEEQLIPYIIYGPGIQKGNEISDPVYIYDIAATTAHILELKTPRAWIGKPTYCALEGESCE